MSLMSLREYSRHRGCTLRAVQKAVESGRIVIAKTEKRGTRIFPFIDSEGADISWTENTDPTQQRVATRGEKMVRVVPKIDEDAELTDENEKTPVGGVSKNATGAGGQIYSKARGMRETYAAMSARLEYELRANKLISISFVNSHFSALASQVQQGFMGFPSRLCALLSAEYQTACDSVLKRLAVGEVIKSEDIVEILSAVMNMKKAHDIIDAEVRKTLQGISDGKAF